MAQSSSAPPRHAVYRLRQQTFCDQPGKSDMRNCSMVFAVLVLAGCGTAVQFPDLQRIDSGSVPAARQFRPPSDASVMLTAADLVVFKPRKPDGRVVSVEAGNCDHHPEAASACRSFLLKQAAFSQAEPMSQGTRAVVPVAALGCVTEFTVKLGSGGANDAVAVLPLPGKCPAFSDDVWMSRQAFQAILGKRAEPGRPAVAELFDVEYRHHVRRNVLPGDAVTVTQIWQVGQGDGDNQIRPVITSSTTARLDEDGRLLIAAPSPADLHTCTPGAQPGRCSRQRAANATIMQSALTARLWEPETCDGRMPALVDAERCLSAGWTPDQLGDADTSLTGEEKQRIRDVCIARLDIDLALRKFNGAVSFENLGIALRPEQQWTVVGHDGAVFTMPWSAQPHSGLEDLEQVYRQRYGGPLVTRWWKPEVNVVIVPSRYRCQAERKPLWLVHRHAAPGDSALARTMLLPGDTVYVSYKMPVSE